MSCFINDRSPCSCYEGVNHASRAHQYHQPEEGPERLYKEKWHLCDRLACFSEELHHQRDAFAHDQQDEEEDEGRS